MDLDPGRRIVNGYKGSANDGVKMHRSGGLQVLICLCHSAFIRKVDAIQIARERRFDLPPLWHKQERMEFRSANPLAKVLGAAHARGFDTPLW